MNRYLFIAKEKPAHEKERLALITSLLEDMMKNLMFFETHYWSDEVMGMEATLSSQYAHFLKVLKPPKNAASMQEHFDGMIQTIHTLPALRKRLKEVVDHIHSRESI